MPLRPDEYVRAPLWQLLELAIVHGDGKARQTIVHRATMAETDVSDYINQTLPAELGPQPPPVHAPEPTSPPQQSGDGFYRGGFMQPVFTPMRASTWDRVDVIPNGMNTPPDQVEELLWELTEGDLGHKTLTQINGENSRLAYKIKTVYNAYHRWLARQQERT